jgi:hypothetical protein
MYLTNEGEYSNKKWKIKPKRSDLCTTKKGNRRGVNQRTDFFTKIS